MADILDNTKTAPPAEPPPMNPITGTAPESLIVPPAQPVTPPTTTPPPPPKPPSPSSSGSIGARKRPGAGAIIGGLLLLLLTLPIAVYYVSQQQSTTDVRSRASEDGVYACRGPLQSCDDTNPCCEGQNLYCMGTEGSRTCQQDDGTIEQCPDGGTCNKINAYHCSALSNGECHENKAVDVGSMDAGRAHAAGCGQVDVVCRGGSKDNLLCGGFSVINSNCSTTVNPPGNTPTPTRPPAPKCSRIATYKDGEAFTDYSTLIAGDTISICVAGDTSTKGRIRVNGGSWSETTEKNSNNEFCTDFTIPEGTTEFLAEAEVFIDEEWK